MYSNEALEFDDDLDPFMFRSSRSGKSLRCNITADAFGSILQKLSLERVITIKENKNKKIPFKIFLSVL